MRPLFDAIIPRVRQPPLTKKELDLPEVLENGGLLEKDVLQCRMQKNLNSKNIKGGISA